MADLKFQQHILDTIDHLRRRKARPDAERIFHALTKKYSLSYTDAKIALERSVESGAVLRVEYKGNISYRNAARKNTHFKRDGHGHGHGEAHEVKSSRKFTVLVTDAIAELVLQEPDYLQWGVPANELLKNILAKNGVKYTKKYVTILLEKEVECGGLIKMENGNFTLGPSKNDLGSGGRKFHAKKETTADEDNRNGANLRVGGRRKRAKKVFDPSDNNMPKKRGRPIGSLNKSTIDKQLAKTSDDSRPASRSSMNGREQGGVCSVCHVQNKKGPNDRMVACRECSNKAHYSCLNGDDMMLRMYPDNTWQCPHCKTCVICFETSDAGYLAVCSICADAYHMGCHQPRLVEKIKCGTKWLCINCQMPEQLAINDIQLGFGNVETAVKMNEFPDDSSSTPPPSGNSSPSDDYQSRFSSPTPPLLLSPKEEEPEKKPLYSSFKSNMSDSQSTKDMDLYENVDPSIPDASNWSYEDVYHYFRRYFPEEEAKVFKEQEIDGRSLLLMRRNDVVRSLKLRLGPALKIFRHVVKLQYRRDDPKLYWL